jgi:hypothetical protein
MKPDVFMPATNIAMLKKRSLLVLLVPCTHFLHIKQEAVSISTQLFIHGLGTDSRSRQHIGFFSFLTERRTLQGYELINMLRKG